MADDFSRRRLVMTGKQLKNSILQWAIQGKLVPQDPNDEPASVLLEKIRAEKARLIKEGKIKKDKNESIIFRGEDNSYYEKFADGQIVCIDEEVPFEIPQGWEWCRLGQLCTVFGRIGFRGYTKADMVQEGKGAISISPSNMNDDGSMHFHSNTYISWFKYDESPEIKIRENDILVVKTGSSYGKTCVVPRLPQKATINPQIAVLKYIGCNNVYLSSVLSSPNSRRQFERYVLGTSIPTFSQERLSATIIPLPPLSEQNRIVDLLKTMQPLVNQYNKFHVNLEELNASVKSVLRKSILQEAIQGKLVAQDTSDEPASVLLQRIKDEKLRLVKEGKLKKKDVIDSTIFRGDDNKYFEKKGKDIVCIDEEIPFDIPESWQWCRINTVCNITNGFTPLRTEDKFWKDGDINWFTVEDIRAQGEYINFTAQKITKEATTPERIVRPGSILLCCTASVGQCAFTNIPTTTNQQFNALTIKDDYRPLVADEYLFLFAKTLKDELHRLSGKTTFEFISVKKVGNILVPIPPFNEQKRIVTIVNKSLASIMS